MHKKQQNISKYIYVILLSICQPKSIINQIDDSNRLFFYSIIAFFFSSKFFLSSEFLVKILSLYLINLINNGKMIKTLLEK